MGSIPAFREFRHTDVVGIFPNEAAMIKLIGAVLLEQNDECQLQHRPTQVEVMAGLAARGRVMWSDYTV